MNTISEFSIYGLYGDRDVIIPFPYSRKILVSENGMGKTTLLNTVYAILSGKFFKLENLEFNQIIVRFADNNQFSISKKDVEKFQQHDQDYEKEYKELQEKLAHDELKNLVSLAREHPLEAFKELKAVQHIADTLNIPPPLLAEKIKVLANESKDKARPFVQQVKQHFNFEILYLTTYRRIEESLHSLGYRPTDLELPSELIQSGMEDVLERIKGIESIIADSQTSETLISEFTHICNTYLVEKKMITESDPISLKVYTNKNRLIPLEMLSSGEKQIISIFAHLYLTTSKACLVLIDEPELSISIEWQRKLLPDMLKAPKCQFLIAATHSPFIFDNELAQYTVDLREYVREYDECQG